MPPKENNKTSTELVLTRVFNAPREVVFEMWANPDHISQWLAPGGMTTVFKKADVRPGGTSHYYMEAPGLKMWGKLNYKEINPPSKIVYEQAFSDENGGLGKHPMAPEFPAEMKTTVIFEDAPGNKTKITLTWIAIRATEDEVAVFEKEKPGMTQGWGGSFGQLDAYLTKIAK